MDLSAEKIAKRIEHTLLDPKAGEDSIHRLCHEALQYNFRAVCVHPCYVELCRQELINTNVRVATVVGFPLGANHTAVKAFEALRALSEGARGIDMVLNIGALKDRRLDHVVQDISAVVEQAADFTGSEVKVIIETALLTDEEKELACSCIIRAGAHYVKTSTGFAGGGANIQDIMLLVSSLAGKAKIKASGGISTRGQAEKLILAGADIIGTSNGISLISG